MLSQQDQIDAWRFMVEETARSAITARKEHGAEHEVTKHSLKVYEAACYFLRRVDLSAEIHIERYGLEALNAKEGPDEVCGKRNS